ncbi:MAG: hypothetical protein JSW61_08295 [Candidatus Thorarchaeota archaeon]|nr:MAG: hypothetical protein JSW61_08295 [Candidatus Thorarchaeota archaeon]
MSEVDYEVDWAYWVNTKTFRLRRLQKSVLVGSVVLIKSRGVTEEGAKYIETDYGIAEKTGVRDISKKEASMILAEQALEYMKQTKRWPPDMTIKDSLKDGDIVILFSPSEYDSFNLRFTIEMVGQKPIDFLEKLKRSKKEPEPVWKVETAKSGRSKCRSCGRPIEEGRFRIGEPYFYEEHLSYRWHHPKCIAPTFYIPLEKLDGYRLLAPEEKMRLSKLLQK